MPYHAPETLDNRALKILVESGRLTPVSLVTMLIRKFDWHDDEGVAWLLEYRHTPLLQLDCRGVHGRGVVQRE